MRRLFIALLVAVSVGFGVFWWLSAPGTSPVVADLPSPDIANGELVFWASGCASCHADENATGEEKLKLGGGHRLASPFGTFVAPNISQSIEQGIGGWEFADFSNALVHGVSPQGKHYYPSFPFTSYSRMNLQDQVDLFAFLKTLPPVDKANEPHELPIVFQWRRPVGIWKKLFIKSDWAANFDNPNTQLERGSYLVEGLGHCGECHTPRNVLGGTKVSQWLSGGPSPDGQGRVPNITPHKNGIGDWSEQDIAYYLESGFTPDYDSAGGAMASVVENMAKLPQEDRLAIAKYLKSIPAIDSD